ncbi:hypothetical protein [Aquamicrobium terrae]|uniref:Dihydropteroate synthase n=1 Tax=Aquamicrobium terrae TaxID=1324945 RepID=A0ABV2MV74_9HYPH
MGAREVIAKWSAVDIGGPGTRPNKADLAIADQIIDALKSKGYVILSPDEVRGMTPGAAEAFAALDLADRLIESAYGTDTPREWNKAFRQVAKARSMKGGAGCD